MPSGEDTLIDRYLKPLVTAPGALGLTDDAAFYTPPEGYDLVMTADAVVAGVHFPADERADRIACKALRVNLSDLAAKGAKPTGFLMTLALPADHASEGFLSKFAAGLEGDIRQYDCALYGGDTVRAGGPLSISIFAFGLVPRGTMVKRAGAKAGDRVFVSGTIGDAALGLKRLQASARRSADADTAFLIDRYRLPRPRTALHEAVRAHASAAMDVSDGLAGDLAKLCLASGVSARIEANAVPLSDAARKALAMDAAWIETILTGGDDYEILCAVPPARVADFRAAAKAAKVPVTDIGEFAEGREQPRFVAADGAELVFARPSFSHF